MVLKIAEIAQKTPGSVAELALAQIPENGRLVGEAESNWRFTLARWKRREEERQVRNGMLQGECKEGVPTSIQ